MKAYRLLVRAYPPGHRRAELLDTLTEMGHRRPTVREAANLLRHGLRARLGRPGRRGVVVLAVLVALTAGFAGAAVTARVAWTAVPDYPAGAALREISETVFPGLGATGERNAEGLFFDPMQRSSKDVFLMGHDEDFAFSTVTLTTPDGFVAGDYRQWTAAARARLAAAGWQIGDAWPSGATYAGRVDETSYHFQASRDGLGMLVSAETNVVGTPPGAFSATAELDRITPWYVTVASLLGLLLGGLAGWLLTGWAARRTEEAGATVRTLTAGPVVAALILLLPQVVLGLVTLGWTAVAGMPPGVPFWWLSLTYGIGCAQLGLLLLAVSLVIAAVGGRAAADRTSEVSL